MGRGRFDPRLNDATQFPVAARAGFGDVRNNPDLITPKLGALHFYQLAIPAPKPLQGSFDEEAAERGRQVFNGQAKCAKLPRAAAFHRAGVEYAYSRGDGDR